MLRWYRSLRQTLHDAGTERDQRVAPATIDAATNPLVAAYLEEVFATFPYTDAAQEWLRETVGFEVQNLDTLRGGGYWYPDQNKVFLFTAQYEAAIHELAHAWWHYRRIGRERKMMDATVALAEETDPRYARMAALAHGYIHGIPAQNWAGMLVEENDWEMFAGLASGMMADMRLIPPYVRQLYVGLYRVLPDDAPSPAALAKHP